MANRIVIAGTNSNVGKTSLTLAIMGGLKRKGLVVQPFKVGPDYIDPAFHTYVTGRVSRNLDYFMMGNEGVAYSLFKNSKTADISVVEGVMGMYDGISTMKDTGSTAHVSKIIKAPVILIIDGSGISSSAAAMVMGYRVYDPHVNLAGIIVNKVSGEHHYQLIKTAIERDVGIPCVGYLKKETSVQLESRHLGLIPSVESELLDKKLEKLVEMAIETIDLEALIQISKDVAPLEKGTLEYGKSEIKKVRIGIAKDKAFNFYYQDNLDMLEEMGAELVPFSPVEDQELPKGLNGLLFGGGFPEIFSKEISENHEMLRELRALIKKGIPTYAECGGFMFLNKQIIDFDHQSYEMLDVFQGESVMTNKLQRFGYVDVELLKDVVVGEKGWTLKGHEFHRSVVNGIDENCYAYKVCKIRDGELQKEWKCGASVGNVTGAYAHIHFYSCPGMPNYFIKKCMEFKGE